MSILDRIGKAFEPIEQWDMRVGDVWLNPKQVAELAGLPEFDRVHPVRDVVIDYYEKTSGARYVGMLFNARVFESPLVPEDQVGLIPAGWEAKLIGPEGCRSF
jgi:hypothetical protein